MGAKEPINVDDDQKLCGQYLKDKGIASIVCIKLIVTATLDCT